MPKVGVILSGCGVFDGSEIHEAVAVLLSLDKRGADVICLAPNTTLDEVDHIAKKPSGAKRNVLTESARIARGDIVDIADVRGSDFDALVLPGGFGAAKNLCDFAAAGPSCKVHPEVERVLREAHEANKPIGFACIAPVVAARVFGGSEGPKLTIGHDKGTAEAIEKMGTSHQERDVDDTCSDTANRIVTTPAYMEAKSISEVFTGIDKMVDGVLEMVAEPARA